MNTANLFSLLRIALIPVFIILLTQNRFLVALGVFGAAAVTDALDGFFARKLKQKTVPGAYLDPIADKLLLVSSFVACSLLDLIPAWLTILVVSRDVIISVGIVLLRISLVHIEIRPSLISKCTTVFQMAAVGISLVFAVPAIQSMKPDIYLMIQRAVWWITGGLTVFTGIHYIFKGIRIINSKEGGLNG